MSFKFNPFTGELDLAAVTLWGDITGTLSDQVDLQVALNEKSDVGHTHLAVDISDLDTDPLLFADSDTIIASQKAVKTFVETHTTNTDNPHLTSIDNLNDSLITLISDNEILTYDTVSGKWINETLAEAGISPTGHTHLAADITDFDTEVGNHPDVTNNTLLAHSQNTDIKLDDGQSNEVTAVDLRIHLDSISNPHSVTKTQVGLSNVTNDAQLKRGANDLNTFSNKASPALLDIIIIEDSEDSFNKKKVSLDNIKGLVLNKARFFLPNTNSSSSKGDYTVAAIGANASLNLTFHVPADFVSLVSIKVIFIANANVVAETIDLTSDYGLIGEVLNFNSESDLGSVLNATIDTIEEKDISSVYSSLLPNHICGLTWKNNAVGTGINILGIELRYA